MRHLLTLNGWTRAELAGLFELAERFEAGEGPRFDGAAVMFFPPSSLRTRVSFERGAAAMGLQPIVFPPETLDKDEDLADVAAYLSSWARVAVIRHSDLRVLERFAAADALPVINAMTDVNHPCEVLTDLYALSREADIFALRYLFVGGDGNIGRAWAEAADAFGLDLRQSSPVSLRMAGVAWTEDLAEAIMTADVVITDGPGPHADALASYRIIAQLLDAAPDGVRLNPCPPFLRGREVSDDAIAHRSFVGHTFKRHLLPVQQAVMAWVT